MAIQQTPQSDEFKQQLRNSLQRETFNSHAIKVARHDNVYTSGDQDEMVYFIESGQIKLLMLSSDGKECLLAIHSGGEIFGGLCLFRVWSPLGNTTTPTTAIPKKITCSSSFFAPRPRPLIHVFVSYHSC